jgi:hypothetical protein
MKIFGTLAFAACMLVGNASAATFFVTGLCGSFSNSSPTAITGQFICPTAASLGVTGSLLPVTNETLVYASDYSNGITPSVVAVTNWTFSGATLAFGADTTTASGAANSTSIVSADGLTLNAFQAGPPTILAGFYDVASAFGTITVNFTNSTTTGQAVATTGYAQILYSYSVTSGTPEPVSMLLFGSGLLGVALIGRKKFARK